MILCSDCTTRTTGDRNQNGLIPSCDRATCITGDRNQHGYFTRVLVVYPAQQFQ